MSFLVFSRSAGARSLGSDLKLDPFYFGTYLYSQLILYICVKILGLIYLIVLYISLRGMSSDMGYYFNGQ